MQLIKCALAIVLLLLAAPVIAQQSLTALDCISNRHIKVELLVAETRLGILDHSHPVKFRAHLLQATCLDSTSLETLAYMLSNFDNKAYDWGFNWVFIAHFGIDPLFYSTLKPGKWRKHYKSADLEQWQQLLKDEQEKSR